MLEAEEITPRGGTCSPDGQQGQRAQSRQLQSHQSKKPPPKWEREPWTAPRKEDKSLADQRAAWLDEGLAFSEGQSVAGLCPALGLGTNEPSKLHGAAAERDLW